MEDEAGLGSFPVVGFSLGYMARETELVSWY